MSTKSFGYFKKTGYNTRRYLDASVGFPSYKKSRSRTRTPGKIAILTKKVRELTKEVD